MDFDSAKENIMPLAGGRNARTLEMALSAESMVQLQNRRREFEEEIHAYEGDDPLAAWFDYILWIEQSYPSGGKENGLMEVLVKCLTTFENHSQYQQDRRMVKLYIKYIDTQPNPQEYYQELYNQGIGTMVADLYICWAYYFDLCGNFQKAEEIFRKGLDARAQPYDELEQAHKHFGFTMSQRILHKDHASNLQFMSSMLERRHALTSLRAHKKKVGSVRTGIAVKSLNPGKVQIDKSTPGTSSNIALAVYTDENNDPNATLHEDAATETSRHTSVIRSIIDSSRKQENMKEPGVWSKARLDDKRKGNLFASSQSSTSRDLGFEIMEDNSSESIQAPPLLKEDDKYHSGIQLPATWVQINKPQREWKVPLTLEVEVSPDVRPCYEKFSLYPKVDEVYSPEELAAYKWFKKHSIENQYTKCHACIWGSSFDYGFHSYPHFCARNKPQSEFSVERIGVESELHTNQKLAFDIKLVYPDDSTDEFQLEEILSRYWKEGRKRPKNSKEETIIMQEEMDETQCVVGTSGRKSMFAARRSIAPNAWHKTSVIPEEESSSQPLNVHRKSVIMPNTSQFVEKEYLLTEQNLNQEVSLSSTPANVHEPEKLDDDKFEIYEDNNDKNEIFKAPNPPIPMKIRTVPALEMEEQSTATFAANESCSTQIFNYFIKSQSVSTPKHVRKTQSYAAQIQEASTSNAVSPPEHMNDTPLCSNASATMFPPPKQLSVIMETTETNTASSGTKSSADTHMNTNDFDIESYKSQQTTKGLTDDHLSPMSRLSNINMFQEKTENLPRNMLSSIPKPPSIDDEFCSLFTTTPEKCHKLRNQSVPSVQFPNIDVPTPPHEFSSLCRSQFVDMPDKSGMKLGQQVNTNMPVFESKELSFASVSIKIENREQLDRRESDKLPKNTRNSNSHGAENIQLGDCDKLPKLEIWDQQEISLLKLQTLNLPSFVSIEPDHTNASFIRDVNIQPELREIQKPQPFKSPFPQIPQIQEQSLHIKDEPSINCIAIAANKTTNEKSILSRFSEISRRQSKVDSFRLDADCTSTNDDLQAASIKSLASNEPTVIDSKMVFLSDSMAKMKSVKDEHYEDDDHIDLGRSIYDQPIPKTPEIQRHIWCDDDENVNDKNTFIYPHVNLDQTRQFLEYTIDQNVNPFNPQLITALLDQIEFYSYIEKLPSCTMVNRIKSLHKVKILNVGNKNFEVLKLVGEGSYGTIFCARDQIGSKMYALKQERPANLWEYYICLELKSRISNLDIMRGFMDIEYALIGNNGSVLISEFSKYGSLINVCHKVKSVTGKNIDEFIVMVMSSQMLSIIDHLHASNIIHADVKPDNFLLISKLSYGSSVPSVQLIDFGVAIDLQMFPPKQKFTQVSRTEGFTCIEMLEKRPWTFQTDLFGLAGTIHVLLFGKYMDIEKKPTGWTIKHFLPRYLNKSLWNTIFSTLLNIRDCNSMPNLQKLRVSLEEEIAENERSVREKINQFNSAIHQ